MEDSWDEVPVIQKKDMVTADESIVLPKYYAKMTGGEILRESTSGSTGQCLEIYWDKGDYTASLFPLWIYRKKYYGITTSDRFCYFYTVHNPYGKEPLQDFKQNSLGFSKMGLTEKRIEEIYRQMLSFDPVWMLLQPSIALLLARYLFSGDIPMLQSLKYIELTGELLTEENKRFIEAAFECPCANQYGSYEVNSMAYECPNGHLHVMEGNVYLEILNEGKTVKEGDEGEIVVTSLHNRVMPFVRYNIGDYGYLQKSTCPCHRGKILKLTRGRKNDVISCPNGEILHSYELIRPFACISEQLDGKLFQYQIEQNEYDRFVIHVVTDEREEEIQRVFYNTLENEYLKRCQYTFIFHDKLLPEKKTGKLKLFTNHMK